MRIEFNLRGAQATVVYNEPGGAVVVEHFEGYADQCETCAGTVEHPTPTARCSNCPGRQDPSKLQHRFGERYNKAEARAVASAMMAAAAKA